MGPNFHKIFFISKPRHGNSVRILPVGSPGKYVMWHISHNAIVLIIKVFSIIPSKAPEYFTQVNLLPKISIGMLIISLILLQKACQEEVDATNRIIG